MAYGKNIGSFAQRSAIGILLSIVCLVSHARAAPDAFEQAALQPDSAWINKPGSPIAVRLRAEFGALGVLSHHIRFGGNGTYFNYRTGADQNTLFFFSRYSVELEIRRRHTVVLLYQPLSLLTEAVLADQLVVGEITFPAGTPTQFGYGFDFYRLDYQYELFPRRRLKIALGGGFQIRNARVSFVSTDGKLAFTQANIGFVPLLRFRGRYLFDNAFFLELEIDGFITPVPAGRGPGGELAFGSILDASFRAGVAITHWGEVFLNLRYLGGGFRGNSNAQPGLASGDRWSANWLNTLIFSVGFGIR